MHSQMIQIRYRKNRICLVILSFLKLSMSIPSNGYHLNPILSLRSRTLLNIFGGSIPFQDVARKISALKDSLNRGDLTKLKAIQEAILQTSAPMGLVVTGHIKLFFFLSVRVFFASHVFSLVEK